MTFRLGQTFEKHSAAAASQAVLNGFKMVYDHDEHLYRIIENEHRKPMSKDEVISMISTRADNHIDEVVMSRGYLNIANCVSYINSSVPRFKSDAEVAIQWRDAMYTRLFQLFDQYRRGDLKSLKQEQVYNRLPKILQKDK